MFKLKQFFSLFILVLATFLLASCSSKPKMPKIRGNRVTFTQQKLTERLSNLSFELNSDLITLYENYENYTVVEGDDNYSVKVVTKQTDKPKSENVWVEHSFSYTANEGKLTAKLNAFESKSQTYFNIDAKTNGKFEDEDFNIEIYNGKYKIEKPNSYTNSVRDLASNFHISYNVTSLSLYASYNFYRHMILELNENNYKKLKFYEKDNYFTIELKITSKDLLDNKTIFKKYFGEFQDYTFKKYDIHFIFVFERGKIIEVGKRTNIDYSINTGTYKYKEDSVTTIKYVNKTPSIKEHKNYNKINNIFEIIK